jgi:hypothetical protein
MDDEAWEKRLQEAARDDSLSPEMEARFAERTRLRRDRLHRFYEPAIESHWDAERQSMEERFRA